MECCVPLWGSRPLLVSSHCAPSPHLTPSMSVFCCLCLYASVASVHVQAIAALTAAVPVPRSNGVPVTKPPKVKTARGSKTTAAAKEEAEAACEAEIVEHLEEERSTAKKRPWTACSLASSKNIPVRFEFSGGPPVFAHHPLSAHALCTRWQHDDLHWPFGGTFKRLRLGSNWRCRVLQSMWSVISTQHE